MMKVILAVSVRASVVVVLVAKLLYSVFYSEMAKFIPPVLKTPKTRNIFIFLSKNVSVALTTAHHLKSLKH